LGKRQAKTKRKSGRGRAEKEKRGGSKRKRCIQREEVRKKSKHEKRVERMARKGRLLGRKRNGRKRGEREKRNGESKER